jgi:hypothetical protein
MFREIPLLPGTPTVDAVVMKTQRLAEYRALQGRRVSIALVDGSRIDDCQLVSARGGATVKVWVFVNGEDLFLSQDDIADVWVAEAA